MREVSIRLKVELIDEDPFDAEWIEQAVEDNLFLDQGEKVSEFIVEQPSIPIIDNHPMTVSQYMHDESDELEAAKTVTISPYSKEHYLL